MNDLGKYLKNEREKKGITLEDASKITRIRKTYLQDLEDGNIGMQSPVFIKGFLRSYAEFLGLDSDDVVEKYNDALNEKKVQAEVEKGFELEPVSNRRRFILPAALAAALAAIYIMTTSEKPDTTEPQVQQAAKAVLPDQKPVLSNTTSYSAPLTVMTTSQTKIFKPITATATPTSPQTPGPTASTAQKTKQTEKQYTLSVKAREVTWLRVTIDNNDPVEVLLREGEGTSWSADGKITVVAGNAGGVDLRFNGKPVGSLGASGKVVTKIFPE